MYLNGTKINEWLEVDPNVDLAQGYIGIQNHGVDDDVFFRNIRIKEGPANTAPVANNDTARTKANRSVAINVLANDTDAEGDALSVTGASDPPHGRVTVRATARCSTRPIRTSRARIPSPIRPRTAMPRATRRR